MGGGKVGKMKKERRAKFSMDSQANVHVWPHNNFIGVRSSSTRGGVSWPRVWWPPQFTPTSGRKLVPLSLIYLPANSWGITHWSMLVKCVPLVLVCMVCFAARFGLIWAKGREKEGGGEESGIYRSLKRAKVCPTSNWASQRSHHQKHALLPSKWRPTRHVPHCTSMQIATLMHTCTWPLSRQLATSEPNCKPLAPPGSIGASFWSPSPLVALVCGLLSPFGASHSLAGQEHLEPIKSPPTNENEYVTSFFSPRLTSL